MMRNIGGGPSDTPPARWPVGLQRTLPLSPTDRDQDRRLDLATLRARLDELGSTLPIIFLTGRLDIQTTAQAIKAGAEDFLIKHCPTTSFAQLMVRSHVTKSRVPKRASWMRIALVWLH
ncbi:hypothetical protein [Bradyrhizobium liaoningense]|uniref:hypothetical protein n=1 Tax=Bradyrhizobium liaoningense TaxID=43992 RepID=UPI002012D362|nr:hypothetical protein [Bradyrhizobium liaoningense]